MSKAKKNLPAVIKATKARYADWSLDGWGNVLTGLGRQALDKLQSATVSYVPLSEMEAEEFYAGDDMARKLVDSLPEDALRKWIAIEVGDAEQSEVIDDYLDDKKAPAAIEKAWKWARKYGGSAILINVDDSQELRKPINLKSIRDLRSLTVLSRYELVPQRWEYDIRSPIYGLPVTYTLSPRRGHGTRSAFMEEIHHSRLILFYGAPLPMRLEQMNNGWGDSVLSRPKSAIRGYATSHDAAATVMQEFNQGVFQMDGLSDLLAQNDDEADAAIMKRLSFMNIARSVCRAVILDKDEDFSNKGAALTGVDKVLGKISERLVACMDMPHTKVLGESPSGLGATGNSEQNDWYDYVGAQQESILRPRLDRLLRIVFAARKGPTGGKEPSKWSFSFNPLKQMSEQDSATLRKTQADTDAKYIESGVLDPIEVSESRFGGDRYSTETHLDRRVRRVAGELTPSEPEPVEPADPNKDKPEEDE